ncbi:glycosyltransferase family 87 protein [Pedobacter agri]|uniref:glycosyltransferase family 87 protein n=1 Tax=Pedobacter agri TaxID=454586 RepID=UPI0029309625|nr:glycosyltransferase family 87 protein [Pedobacter agri]
MNPSFFTQNIKSFYHNFNKTGIVLSIWLIITLVFSIQGLLSFRYNNYLIFENAWRNLTLHQNFYMPYPNFHEDANHYGPIFSVFIAPFAWLNNGVGLFAWNIFNCLFLFKAIQTLKIAEQSKINISYIVVPCLIVSMLSEQFNPTAGALIILSYTQLNKNSGFWSAACIVLGTFIKLYGIMGLAFFFFVKDKPRFILYVILWSVILFILPMLFSSKDFILQSYQDWYHSLLHKNQSNVADSSSDLSILGFIRNALNSPGMSNLPALICGCILFLVPFLNIKNYSTKEFQLYILASALLFPVLFSSGAEDCTYVISIAGVGIWFILGKPGLVKNILLAILLIFACNLPLAIFPKFGKEYPIFMSILSVPFFIVWLIVIYNATFLKKSSNQMLVDYNPNNG